MNGVEQFLADFSQFCSHREVAQIMDLNTPGDISGWGLYAHQIYSSRGGLEGDVKLRNTMVKTAEVLQHPIKIWGNDQVCCLATDFELVQKLQDGSTRELKNIRASWFLEWTDHRWKIRHGHISQPINSDSRVVSFPVPASQESVGVKDGQKAVFQKWLDSRAAMMTAGDVEGLLTLLSRGNTSFHWGMCAGEMFKSYVDVENWYKKLFERYRFTLIYDSPVVFVRADFACLSCHGRLTSQCRATGVTETYQPLRSTFMLQKTDGKWALVHSHIALPQVE